MKKGKSSLLWVNKTKHNEDTQTNPPKGLPGYSVHILYSGCRKLLNESDMEISSFNPKPYFPSFWAFCEVLLADIPVSTRGSINQESKAIRMVEILETVDPIMNAQL